MHNEKVKKVDEFDFIESIKQKTYKQQSLLKGIGDDAAVFRNVHEDIVTAVDTLVENIHFSKETTTPFHIGYRALASNISDMAAMGSVPKFYLVSIVIPQTMKESTLHDIYAGMNKIATQYEMDLIGGDTVSGEQLTISITIIGSVEKNKARYRCDARHNDILFVTGTLGDSAAGLHVLMNKLDVPNSKRLIRKHQMPVPRVTFANSLQGIERLSLNDISDGIANELKEIAEASNVTITIDDHKIPISDEMKQFTIAQQTKWKYFGGEDYELVGTVSKQDWLQLKKIAEKIGLRVTKIGNVTYNEQMCGQVFVQKGSKISSLEALGYKHLK